MAGKCIVTVTGHLGGDPESKSVGQGVVCNFSIAVSEKSRDGETTAWYRVAAWGKLGELCQQYLAKGRQVSVTGKLKPREYDGKNGRATSLDVDALDVTFLGGGEKGESRPARSKPAPAPYGRGEIDDNDIPFARPRFNDGNEFSLRLRRR